MEEKECVQVCMYKKVLRVGGKECAQVPTYKTAATVRPGISHMIIPVQRLRYITAMCFDAVTH